MPIGEITLEEIKGQVWRHLANYRIAINEVYSDLGDEEGMRITFSVKIAPKKGQNEVKTAISFVTGKVKDEITSQVDERQIGLFEESSSKQNVEKTENESWPCPKCGGDAWHRDGCREIEGG